MRNLAIIVPSLKGGGAEKVAALLSKELDKNYNVYLIIFDGENKKFSHGGKLINLNIKAHPNYLIKLYNFIRRILKVKKIKKEYNINITISLMQGPNIINVFSKYNDKVITSIHRQPSSSFSSLRISEKILSKIYNKSDKIITVSKGVTEAFTFKYKINKGIVKNIYNPVSLDEINNTLKVSRNYIKTNYNDSFVITNMGRLVKEKGQWHLIRSLVEVKEKIPNIKLLIIGEGELSKYLKQLVNDLNLSNYVDFLNFQNNPFKYLNTSDLFIMSSINEGFGNVIIESLACGVPVISTDYRSGAREILAPDTGSGNQAKKIEIQEYGILIPVFDGKKYTSKDPLTKEEKILAQSIIRMYKDNKLRKEYSTKAIKRAEDFDLDSIVGSWRNMIENL